MRETYDRKKDSWADSRGISREYRDETNSRARVSNPLIGRDGREYGAPESLRKANRCYADQMLRPDINPGFFLEDLATKKIARFDNYDGGKK